MWYGKCLETKIAFSAVVVAVIVQADELVMPLAAYRSAAEGYLLLAVRVRPARRSAHAADAGTTAAVDH